MYERNTECQRKIKGRQKEGRRRKDAIGRLFILDGTTALQPQQARYCLRQQIRVDSNLFCAARQLPTRQQVRAFYKKGAVSSAHSTKLRSGTMTPTLRHVLWSSLGSLYLTSMFLQGFLQIPINLAAIISYYGGKDTEGNLCGLVASRKSSWS